jgi:excisionase family DNA binding protein
MASDPATTAELLTIPEAAQRAGVSPWTVKGWITRGQVASVRIDRRRRIHPDALTAGTRHSDGG